jgi:hypothetical protein
MVVRVPLLAALKERERVMCSLPRAAMWWLTCNAQAAMLIEGGVPGAPGNALPSVI